MRFLTALALLCALMSAVGCSRVIDGTARMDHRQSGVAISNDGNGIVTGDPAAPIQLEIYTEPQCSHCGHLQAEYGDEIKSYLRSGRLAVTYRPMTFLDSGDGRYSAVVGNALFLAAESGLNAGQFQTLVQRIWSRAGIARSTDGSDVVAQAADAAELPTVRAAIESGRRVIDPDSVNDANAERLSSITGAVATPTVYDLNAHDVVDITDKDWLVNLFKTV